MTELQRTKDGIAERHAGIDQAANPLIDTAMTQAIGRPQALATLSPEASHFIGCFARLASQGGAFADLNYSLRSNDPAFALELQAAGLMTALERPSWDTQRGAVYRDIQPTEEGKAEVLSLAQRLTDQARQLETVDKETTLAVLKLMVLREYVYLEPEVTRAIPRSSVKAFETAEGNFQLIEHLPMIGKDSAFFQPMRSYLFNSSGDLISSELSNDILSRDKPLLNNHNDSAQRANQIILLAKSEVQDLLDDPAAAERLADIRRYQAARRSGAIKYESDDHEQDDRDHEDEVHTEEDVANWIGPDGTWS